MLEELLSHQALTPFTELVKNKESCLIEELWDCPKAILICLTQRLLGRTVLLISGGMRESRLLDDLSFFSPHFIAEFPAGDKPGTKTLSSDITGQRLKILDTLLSQTEPLFIATTLQGALQKLEDPQALHLKRLKVSVGDSYSVDELAAAFQNLGYERRPLCTDKGEMALRGGIVDLFPVGCMQPYRLEIDEDKVLSIRLFDAGSQKTTEKVQQTEIITSAKETAETTLNASLFDYLPKETVLVFDDMELLEDNFVALKSLPLEFERALWTLPEFLEKAQRYVKLYFTSKRIEELSSVTVERGRSTYSHKASPAALTFSFFNETFRAKRFNSPFLTPTQFVDDVQEEDLKGDELLLKLKQYLQAPFPLHIVTSSPAEKEYLLQKVHELEFTLPSDCHFHQNYLSSGLGLSDPPFLLLPMTEVTHRYRVRRQVMRASTKVVSHDTLQLTAGDLVVHLNHGIGKYIGIENRLNHNKLPTEFFVLEYEGRSRLFVPFSESYLLTKYVGTSVDQTKLHTLGSSRWKKTKEQTERSIAGYAKELIQLYASRKYREGVACPPDSDMMKSFEQDFSYVETEDQVNAILDIKKDMENTKVMDRLLCGDVGFGKTEVAMRAAFKAVVDGGKQVAVLVPTTVLALQHYETFQQRMGSFPIKIAQLSRFCKPKEIKQTLAKLQEGQIDIVVGTHRLLSKDILFKDLGLIVVDEEQRFGVKAKEHLKTLKAGVDCLSLSATPIPRTLYMSLISARDMSTLATPPQDRLPVKTIIAENSDELVKQALMRELARDGQAYFIYNRVETIYERAEKLQKLLPSARIVVGHGQMSGDELDTIFHSFKSGKADILVATTIVENGLDIPNANTIIVESAQNYGLADLYQLRGRVGRWNRPAYTFLLTPKRGALSEVARLRLDAFAEASSLGGGMRIAMRDLEIRGAGDLLGIQQSGHIATVGFHLYCRMLKRAMEELQGKGKPMMIETKLELPYDARLPSEYINETTLRMEFYQRLGTASTPEEIILIADEITDRFGPMPKPAQWLYCFFKLKTFASSKQVSLIKFGKATLQVDLIHKGKTTSYTIPFATPKTPQEMEQKVISALQKMCP